jgi:two-component system chemotaxis response regulator CheY
LKLLQKDSLFKNSPAIVVSTEGSTERIREAINAGAKGFIKKPFLPEDIRRVLYDVIGVGGDGEYQEDRRDSEEVDF